METLKLNDGTVHSHGTLTQSEVGSIDLGTMAYSGSDGQVHFAYSVEVRSWKAGQEAGWGRRIFEGSLEEAIDIFRAGLEARKEAQVAED